MRIALPALDILKAIGAAGGGLDTVIFAHEFMGLPTALAARLDNSCNFTTLFYAHEAATFRRIVEKKPGHDTMFYNVMREAANRGLYVNDIFGDQSSYFKHSLVEASRFCDAILAVGDCVVEELKFIAPEFKMANIALTYNGIPYYEIGLAEKQQSKDRLLRYCRNILDYSPDYIFTHVTRLVVSKGLWRDFRVLEHLDKEFTAQNKTAVMFILSTEAGPRPYHDITAMEQAYNWPVAHRQGWPDLTDGEAALHCGVQEFNTKSRNIKVVFINQFGFSPDTCGERMPRDMEFMDVRRGSDVEFGQSIYEPFGIAQLEPLTFGGLCVITNVCGCAGFLDKISQGKKIKNVIVADYTDLGNYPWNDIEDLLRIGKPQRDTIERKISEKVALEICARLPKTQDEQYDMLCTGYELAKKMSWHEVVDNYILRGIEGLLNKAAVCV